MTNSSINQTDAYYLAIEEARKNGTTPKPKSPSGPFIRFVMWVTVAVMAAGFGLFCITTLADAGMDQLGGKYITECKNGDKYSGKIPTSYEGDIFSYHKEVANSKVSVMSGGCSQIAHGDN